MANSLLADAIRPLWLPGIETVNGKRALGLAEWFQSGPYQILQNTHADAFVLDVLRMDADLLLEAFAADVNRLSTAAFETSTIISRHTKFPRSTAWLIINSYYAAFFSAHALIRILGASCSQLAHRQVNRINSVADLFGSSAAPVGKGLYRGTLESFGNTLSCNKLEGGGVHESFWSAFHQRLRQLSSEVLAGTTLPIEQRRTAFAKLEDFATALTNENSLRGNWLSNVRNQVNYGQQLGAWYPYGGQKKTADELFSNVTMWKNDPMNISLSAKNPLRYFQEVCNFAIGLCRVVMEDLNSRCPSKDSFCRYGSIAFLRLLGSGI
jgi:hypothetical protein